MRRHELSLHFGLKFQCHKCDKEFKSKAKLRNHLRHIHEDGGIEETNFNVTFDDTESNLNCAKQDQIANFDKGSNAISFKNQERGPSKVMKGKWIVKLERINVSQKSIIWKKQFELCS